MTEVKDIRIAGAGVATLDIYVDKGRMYPGGNEYNVACHAARIGAQAGFLGVYGNDQAGKILEDELSKCNVDTKMSRHEDGSSGYSIVELDEAGDRNFLRWNEEGVTDLHPFDFTWEELRYIKSFDVISVGRLSDVSVEQIIKLHDNGIDVCYDFHEVFSSGDILRIAPYIKYAFFSCSHLSDAETKRCLEQAVSCGCSLAVGTSGPDAVWAYDGTRFYEEMPRDVEATDTLGAGDSFIAAFLVWYLKCMRNQYDNEAAIVKSLKNAVDYSAEVVIIEGSIGRGYDVNVNNIGDIVNL